MPSNWIFWVLFNVFVLAMLALDLGVFHRKKHVVKFARPWAGRWSGSRWPAASLCSSIFSGTRWSAPRAGELRAFAGIRYRLSDRSIAERRQSFRLPADLPLFPRAARVQHEVLFWGVVGALVMRAIFIAVGIKLLNRFHWVIYIFGAILIYSGISCSAARQEDQSRGQYCAAGLSQAVPVTKDYEGDQFFVRRGGCAMRRRWRLC